MNFTQQISAKFRVFAGFLAAFILIIGLTSKIPSSHCHCKDPVKSKKEACPFGALRTLTFVQPQVTPPVIVLSVGALAPSFFVELVSALTVITVNVQARAPPGR
jgi:hypothetical protein